MDRENDWLLLCVAMYCSRCAQSNLNRNQLSSNLSSPWLIHVYGDDRIFRLHQLVYVVLRTYFQCNLLSRWVRLWRDREKRARGGEKFLERNWLRVSWISNRSAIDTFCGATPILCYVQIYAMEMWNLNKQNCICRHKKCPRPKIDYDVLMFRVLRAILTRVNCGNVCVAPQLLIVFVSSIHIHGKPHA